MSCRAVQGNCLSFAFATFSSHFLLWELDSLWESCVTKYKHNNMLLLQYGLSWYSHLSSYKLYCYYQHTSSRKLGKRWLVSVRVYILAFFVAAFIFEFMCGYVGFTRLELENMVNISFLRFLCRCYMDCWKIIDWLLTLRRLCKEMRAHFEQDAQAKEAEIRFPFCFIYKQVWFLFESCWWCCCSCLFTSKNVWLSSKE